VTKDGTINAWRANTATSMDTAVIVKDYSDHGADQPPVGQRPARLPAFTGVAMTTSAYTTDLMGHPIADNRLYVADFQNKRIQVFNNQWNEISSTVAFERPAGVPEDYSPFNIQCINDRIYVAYAVIDEEAEEPAFDVPDVGAGHVVEYDRDGHIVREFADS